MKPARRDSAEREAVRYHGTDPDAIRRRLAEIAALEASRRRIVPWSVCGIVISVAIALGLMAWGFSMDDDDLGPVIFFSGVLLGNLGIVLTLLWAYRAAED